MLGGHRIDLGRNSILKLGVWTIINIRWPLLRHRLALTLKSCCCCSVSKPLRVSTMT